MKLTSQTLSAEYLPSEEIAKSNNLTKLEVHNYAMMNYLFFNKTDIHVGWVAHKRFDKIKETVLKIILNSRDSEKRGTEGMDSKFADIYNFFLQAKDLEQEQSEFSHFAKLIELYHDLAVYEKNLREHEAEILKTDGDKTVERIKTKADTFRVVSDDIILELIEIAKEEEPFYYYDQVIKIDLLIDLLNEIKEKLNVQASIADINDSIDFETEEIEQLSKEIELLRSGMKAA